MKDHGPRNGRRTFVLSQDKSQFLEAPLSKRDGKQPIYYDIGAFEGGVHASTSFQQLIQKRALYGEVIIRRESPEEWDPEYKRLLRKEHLRQLREAVVRIAREDRLEGRLTTIILDFINAVRSAKAHQRRRP